MSRAPVPVQFGPRVVRVEAVAFDKDGTLLQTGPFWTALYRIRLGLITEVAGAETAAIWEREMGATGGRFDRRGPFTVAPLEEEVVLLAGLLYRQMGWSWERCRSTAWQICEETNRSLNLSHVTRAREGAVDAVLALKAAGVAVGVVTSDNAGRALRALSLVGLPGGIWDFLLTPADVERPKPAPDMVEQACRLVGCQPALMAVVGDAAVDMKMAKSAGAIAVAVPEAPEDQVFLAPLADVLIDGLGQIRPAVRL